MNGRVERLIQTVDYEFSNWQDDLLPELDKYNTYLTIFLKGCLMKKMSGERENPLARLNTALIEATASYEAQLEQVRQSWNRNCRGVDGILERLARKHNGELNIQDIGARAVVWYKEGIGYSISLVLGEEGEHPPLTVYSVVRQDDKTSLTRTRVQLPEELIDTPVRVRDFGRRVNNLARTLHQQSRLLSQSPLPDTVRVTHILPLIRQ